MSLQISERVRALAAQAQADLRPQLERIDAIAETVCRRVQFVQQMSAEQQPSFAAHSTAGDVEKDIAEDYTMKMDL